MTSSNIDHKTGLEVRDAVAAIDPLTGLAGAEALAPQLRSREGALALVLFDLCGLKTINQRHGYAAGDHLLRVAASRLRRVCAEPQWALRLEGGLFAVTVDAEDLANVPPFVERALKALSAPLRGRWAPIAITASVGVALRPWHGDSARDLLAHARQALDEAKREGPRTCRLYHEATAKSADPVVLEREFACALREGEWELHYQPQIAWPAGTLDGVEALLRWRHPDRGLLLPKDFLDELAADRSVGLVGRWVIEEACRDLACWRCGGHTVPRVAVNLFAGASEGLADATMQALAANGLAPSDMELEVTETIVLDSGSTLSGELRALRAAGVDIALDDFGTGFACLATLRDLPITCLKIDRSFVRDQRPGSADYAVVAALLTLGRELGLRIVAEGVERSSQLRRLSRMGCRVFQGHLFSKAVSAAELVDWMDPGRTQAVLGPRNQGDRSRSPGDRLVSLEEEY